MVDSVSRIRSLPANGYGTVCGCRGDYGIMNTEMYSYGKLYIDPTTRLFNYLIWWVSCTTGP